MKELNYEESFQELEKVVKELEEGKSTLEESFRRFSEGVTYYHRCKEILTELEGKVEILSKAEETEIPVLDED